MADPAECTTGGSGKPRVPAPPLGREASPEERNRHSEANRVDCVRIVHWMRNALSYVPKAHQSMAAAALRQAHVQPDRATSSQMLRHVADQLRDKWPKLGGFIDDSETDVLTHMDFPAQHRTKIHSTNPIERLNKEVKRRADVVGVFPNEGSIIRLIGAVLLEANDEWQTQSRYMQTEAMAELTPVLTDAVPTQISTQAA